MSKIVKIVLDLDIEIEDDVDPNEITEYLENWYGPGAGHQTAEGIDFEVAAVMVVNEGSVEL